VSGQKYRRGCGYDVGKGSHDPILRIWDQLQTVEALRKPVRLQHPSDLQLARGCYVSSVFHYAAAVRLSQSKLYGSGLSHLVFGIEEIGKGLIYRWSTLGLFSMDPKDRGSRHYVERAMLSCHQCKQRVLYISFVGKDLAPEMLNVGSIDPQLERLWKDPEAKLDLDVPKSAEEMLSRVVPALEKDRPRAVAIASALVEMELLERVKWLGLYVDDHEGLELTAPWYVSAERFGAMRARFRQLYDVSAPLLQPGLPKEAGDFIRRLVPQFSGLPTTLECEHYAGRRYRAKLKSDASKGGATAAAARPAESLPLSAPSPPPSAPPGPPTSASKG
jgi:hypothetical protein